MAFIRKTRVKKTKNKYLKPGALAQLRCARAMARSCTDLGKKRVALVSVTAKIDLLHQKEVAVASTPVASPDRTSFHSIVDLTDGVKQNLSGTPTTPKTGYCDSQSRLESLPVELLVKIVCHLHHDQLRAVFHVSQRIRMAVMIARQCHFNYTTPDRFRQEMLRTRTPLPTEHWPFKGRTNGKEIWVSSPSTPKAPRHGPRPSRYLVDLRQIAAVLFPESALPTRFMVPPGLPKPVCKSLASNRVLFYEDELCQAVAHNKLH